MPLSLASLNFASGGNYALFQMSTDGPPPLLWPPGGPSLVIWMRPLEATMPFSMVPALTPPRPLRLAPHAPEFGPFEFCLWRQLCPFPDVHCWPSAPPVAPGGPSLVIWLRPLEASIPFSMVLVPPQALQVGPQAPEVGPQAPEFGPIEFCIWRQLCPNMPLPRPRGGPSLVIWLRAIMPSPL